MTNAEILNKDLQEAKQQISELKGKLKGNMSLMQAKKLMWDEIIEEIENDWEFITMMHEQKVAVKDFEYSIISTKEDGVKNSQVAQKFIMFVNERKLSEMRPNDLVERVGSSMEITKMIRMEEARVKVEEFLGEVAGKVDVFNQEFE